MKAEALKDMACSKLVHPAKGITTTPGAGKSKSIRSVINDVAQTLGQSVIVVLLPDLVLAKEQLSELRYDLPHLQSELYLGISQPDPTNSKFKMCKRHRIDELVNLGVSIKALCGNKQAGYCRHHAHASKKPCAHSLQSLKKPDIWICTHAMLFMKAPDFFGPIKLIIIDESFFRAAYKPNSSIDLDEIEDSSNYETYSYLRTLSSPVCRYIRGMPDGFLEVSHLSAFVNDQLVNALDTVNKVQFKVSPNATDKDIDDVINQFKGSRSHAITTFWSLTAQSHEFKVGLSPSLFKKTENGKAKIHMKFMSYLDPTWNAPAVLLDSTMPVGINKKFFKNLKVAQIHTKSSHTRYIQITDSLLSKTQFARTESTFQRVLDIITVAVSQISASHPIKVLVACSKYVEDELNRLGLPPGCEAIHYGAVTGSNKYGSVPCIIAVGRIEIPVAEAEQQAAILNGKALDTPSKNYRARQVSVKNRSVTAYYHLDPLTEEIRQHWNESQLLQVIGRGRPIRRDLKNPLDVILLTSVPLPIEEDRLTLTRWKDIQPTQLEVMLAQNGIVPLGTGELMRHYPDLFNTKDKARTAIKQLTDKFPNIASKSKVGGISSISIINRQYPTYFNKTTALIRYTTDTKGAKPVYALIRRHEGKSLQDTLNDLTPTKSIRPSKKSSKQKNIPGISYEIAGFILKEPHPLPNKLDARQYFDENERNWVLKPNSNTTVECGVEKGRAFYLTKRYSAA
jgi:hypothetical protein